MSQTNPGVKVRTLAAREAGLRVYFGTTPFRWDNLQLAQGYIPKSRGQAAIGGGTSSLRYRIVSRVNDYNQAGPWDLERVRIQFDVLDLDPATADLAATAVTNFLNTINLVTGQQFGSPVQTPANFPTFVNNRRPGIEPQPGPVVYVESIDVVCWNSTAN